MTRDTRTFSKPQSSSIRIELLLMYSLLHKSSKTKRYSKKWGGATYISELANSVPTAAHVEHYAKIVKNSSTKRRIMKAATKLVDMSVDEGFQADELLDKAETEIFSLSQTHLDKSFTQVRDALADSFDRLDELHKSKGGLRGVATGFSDIDNTLAGLQRSNLIILAARPGMGKTSLALNIAQNVAVKDKRPVGFFSLEMSKEELVDRLLVAEADIDAWKLKTGKLSEDDFTKLSNAMGTLAEAPIYIDDTPALSILEMRTKARRLQVEHGVDLIIVDYLQLARGRTMENRVQEVSEISQGLKNLARELKVPVLALSQLNRQVEQRGTKRPFLADLRESGSIEQDADVVMFLWREDSEDLSNYNLDVAKHRNGPLAQIGLFFRGDRIKFYSKEKTVSPEPPPEEPAEVVI
ncbi:replicative DNA helicase [Patescibacteria group bacterium]